MHCGILCREGWFSATLRRRTHGGGPLTTYSQEGLACGSPCHFGPHCWVDLRTSIRLRLRLAGIARYRVYGSRKANTEKNLISGKDLKPYTRCVADVEDGAWQVAHRRTALETETATFLVLFVCNACTYLEKTYATDRRVVIECLADLPEPRAENCNFFNSFCSSLCAKHGTL